MTRLLTFKLPKNTNYHPLGLGISSRGQNGGSVYTNRGPILVGPRRCRNRSPLLMFVLKRGSGLILGTEGR